MRLWRLWQRQQPRRQRHVCSLKCGPLHYLRPPWLLRRYRQLRHRIRRPPLFLPLLLLVLTVPLRLRHQHTVILVPRPLQRQRLLLALAPLSSLPRLHNQLEWLAPPPRRR